MRVPEYNEMMSIFFLHTLNCSSYENQLSSLILLNSYFPYEDV